MKILKYIISISLFLLLPPCFAEQKINTQTKVSAWEKTSDGVTFYIKQIPPDTVKAFYLGRGFSLEQIKPYSSTCVYTAILRNNNAPGRIHFIRKDWSIMSKNKSQAPKSNTDWLKQFKQSKVTPAALIAFRFAQLPEEQEYDPIGDWNRGMLSSNLALGSTFDLLVRWDIEGKPYAMTLSNISCTDS